MIIPRPLTAGDKVAIVAPCSPVKAELIAPAAKFIESLGYVPELFPSCFRERGYLAGDDCRRASDINQAFADPKIRGIIAIRGGYGGARLANYLNYDIIRANPKAFCGFSDVTVLHIMLNKFCNLVTFHTPMPSNALMCGDDFSRQCFADILRGDYPQKLINCSGDIECICGGRAEGILTGGNLTVICSTVGTPYEIEAHGRILFLEDVGEEAYAVDRCLIHLRDSGILDRFRGIILGTWQNCMPCDELQALFDEILKPLNIPVLRGLQCGHSTPSISIPLGMTAEIRAQANKCEVYLKGEFRNDTSRSCPKNTR